MEHKSTKGSNLTNVPNQTDDSWFSFFEFPEVPKVDFDTTDFEEFRRNLEAETQRLIKQSEEYSTRLMKESEGWQKKCLEEFEKRRAEMTFREYVDERGYKVCEGRSKDGKYVIIQKSKVVGNSVDRVLEIVENGKIFFKSSSITDSYSYMNENGDFVTVEDKKRNNTTQRTYKTPHSRVIKRKKKTTKKWKYLLIFGICVAVIYFMFFR